MRTNQQDTNNGPKHSHLMFLFSYSSNSLKISAITPATVGLVLIFLWMCRESYLFYRMKRFYNQELQIDESELEDYTWRNLLTEVVKRKENVTRLEIYQRILRFQNYAIAMVNKDILHDLNCCRSSIFGL